VLGKAFSRIQSVTLTRPRRVLAVTLAACVAAAWLGLGVEFRTSRNELAPPDDPDQMRWIALLEDYKASEIVIACIEAEPGLAKTDAELERFTDLLSRSIAADPLVAQVFHRLDLDWILTHGLYLLSPDTREAVATAVEAEWDFLSQLARSSALPDLNRRLAARLRGRASDGASVPEEAEPALSFLNRFLKAQRAFIEDAGRSTEAWLDQPALYAAAGDQVSRLANGYLKTYDGRTLFALVTPHSTDDSVASRRRLLRALGEHAQAASTARPGFHVAFTGQPAMTVEEMDTIRFDTWRTSVMAVIGVSVLTLFVFRWKAHSLLVLIALAVGVLWSFGAVRLELGYLNLITSAFISTLVGVGVAYGIHPDPRGLRLLAAPARHRGPQLAAAARATVARAHGRSGLPPPRRDDRRGAAAHRASGLGRHRADLQLEHPRAVASKLGVPALPATGGPGVRPVARVQSRRGRGSRRATSDA
jgi:hypothetical protein